MARWLLCDYGEVLCLTPSEPDKAEVVRATGWRHEAEEFWTDYWAGRMAYDRGDVTAAEFWTNLTADQPAPDHLQRIIDADIRMWLRPNPAAVAAAERAADRGLRLAILSNAPVEVAEAIDQAPWLAPFSCKFFSCYLRANKPEPAAYEQVLTALEAEPGEVTFFDDRPRNVAGATALGIDAHLFERPAQLDTVSAG